jgi:hypothetical protein
MIPRGFRAKPGGILPMTGKHAFVADRRAGYVSGAKAFGGVAWRNTVAEAAWN